MEKLDPESVALRFNERINKRDLKGLTQLMTDNHVFTDKTGNVTCGRDEMTRRWSRFFTMFPDYRNIFSRVETEQSVVIVIGYSECSEEVLSGPAIWKAVIHGHQVAEWRVYDDTQEVREQLGVA